MILEGTVLPKDTRHVAMLGRGSFLRFKCSFPTFTFPHCPSDHRVAGELALPHDACLGASPILLDHLASDDGFHLSIRGSPSVNSTSHKAQLLAVNLVRCINSLELAGLYFVDTLPQPDIPSVPTTSVASGRHPLPITAVGNPEPSTTLLFFLRPAVARSLRYVASWSTAPPPSLSSGLRRRARWRLL